jgi:hypothetical protein
MLLRIQGLLTLGRYGMWSCICLSARWGKGELDWAGQNEMQESCCLVLIDAFFMSRTQWCVVVGV